MYIGAYQYDKLAEPAGHWAWVTGETWDFTNWDTGKPNNGGAWHVEDYLTLGTNQWNIGRWDDSTLHAATGGGYGVAYIVEYEAGNPVPEPATMLLFGTGLSGFVGYRLRKKKQY